MLCSEVSRSRHLCDSSICLHNFKKRFSCTEKRILSISGCKSKKAPNTLLPEKGCKLFTLKFDVPDILYAHNKKQAFLRKNHILRKNNSYFFKFYKVDVPKTIEKANY